MPGPAASTPPAGTAFAAVAVPRKAHPDKAAHEAALVADIDRLAPDIVCLAGYMRLLTGDFIRRYRGRIINIHPSLLPLFPGLDTHRRAIEAGMRVHGCTVHFVTEAMDEGPIIAQAAVPLLPGDTPDDLAARVLEAEHRLYPQALAMLARGDVAMGAEFEERLPAARRARVDGGRDAPLRRPLNRLVLSRVSRDRGRRPAIGVRPDRGRRSSSRNPSRSAPARW